MVDVIESTPAEPHLIFCAECLVGRSHALWNRPTEQDRGNDVAWIARAGLGLCVAISGVDGANRREIIGVQFVETECRPDYVVQSNVGLLEALQASQDLIPL
jgi:hypothetical protein